MEHTTETPVIKTASTVRGKRYTRYQVTYRDDNGKRCRKYFKSLADAREFARKCDVDEKTRKERRKILERKVGVDDAAKLSAESIRDAIKALSILRGTASLERAALAFVEAREHNAKDIPTIAALYAEYLERSAGLRAASVNHIVQRIKPLLTAFGSKRVDDITSPDIVRLLGSVKRADGKPYSQRSISHLRVVWHGFFEYAVELGLITENPAKRKTRARRNGNKAETVPEIFTIAETKAILTAAKDHCPDMIAPLALGLFAGIRTAEIRRLTWDRHIDLKRGLVMITADVAKKRSVRNVTMSANLLQWLALAPFHTGKVFPFADITWRRRMEQIVEKADGLEKWKANAMRHSFGSYHLEHHRNVTETALQMGHRDAGDLLFEHYRQLTTPEIAAEYWQIEPPRDKGAIAFPKKNKEKSENAG